MRLPLNECFLIDAFHMTDNRGEFAKIYQRSSWMDAGLPFEISEEFFTCSAKGVIRGMHFQWPPHEHTKAVTCMRGRILDVILDMRKTSPTFGEHHSLILDASKPQSLVLPPGIAHGYLCLEDSIVLYRTDTEFNAECDDGIHFDSFGFEWPIDSPILSEKDENLPPFIARESRF